MFDLIFHWNVSNDNMTFFLLPNCFRNIKQTKNIEALHTEKTEPLMCLWIRISEIGDNLNGNQASNTRNKHSLPNYYLVC